MSRKRFTHGVTFSTEVGMYEQLVELANRKRISVSNVIRQALEKVLNETQEHADIQAKEVQDENVE